MCESNVFRIKDGGSERIMDDVVLINVDGEKLTLSTVLGKSVTVNGQIVKIDSERHEVYIR